MLTSARLGLAYHAVIAQKTTEGKKARMLLIQPQLTPVHRCNSRVREGFYCVQLHCGCAGYGELGRISARQTIHYAIASCILSVIEL